MASSTITISAHCHCNRFNISHTIPSTALPLKSSICHCNACRHTSGQLIPTQAVIPTSPPSTSALKVSKASGVVQRYFCPTCGASVLTTEPHEWDLTTGVFTAETMTALRLDRVQLWISDTEDGGCAKWLSKAAGVRELRSGDRESRKLSMEELVEMMVKSQGSVAQETSGEREEILSGECRCGQVRFCVPRPPTTDGKPQRYKASFCACTSCRLTSGSEITAWTTIPLSNLLHPDGNPLDLAQPISGLGRYESSRGVWRFFCQGCGAKAFFWNRGSETMARREEVDVSVGLLRGKGTVMVEHWLDWSREVGYGDEAIDSGFVRGFARAFREEEGEV